MRTAGGVLAGLLVASGLAASPATAPQTGTTRDDPVATDECPEVNPELDPARPVETLYAPEPEPAHDLCATWVTATWEGEGAEAVLERVTFGLRTLGDVELGPHRAYAFSWVIPDFSEPSGPPLEHDGSCRSTLFVSEGPAGREAALEACDAPVVDYLAGAPLPAAITVDGSVLEVEVRVADTTGAFAASLVNGGTLHGFCPVTYLVEPWAEDAIHAGDITFVPPEPAPAD